MARCFICHAGSDKEKAEIIHDKLTSQEVECFLDSHPKDGIYPGEEWKSVIVDNIKKSDMLLFLISEASNASLYCQEEIEFAKTYKVPVIPLKFESNSVSTMNHVQIIDFSDD